MNESISGNNYYESELDSVSSNDNGLLLNQSDNILSVSSGNSDSPVYMESDDGNSLVEFLQAEQLQYLESIKLSTDIMCAQMGALVFVTLFVWVERKIRDSVRLMFHKKGGSIDG